MNAIHQLTNIKESNSPEKVIPDQNEVLGFISNGSIAILVFLAKSFWSSYFSWKHQEASVIWCLEIAISSILLFSPFYLQVFFMIYKGLCNMASQFTVFYHFIHLFIHSSNTYFTSPLYQDPYQISKMKRITNYLN